MTLEISLAKESDVEKGVQVGEETGMTKAEALDSPDPAEKVNNLRNFIRRSNSA